MRENQLTAIFFDKSKNVFRCGKSESTHTKKQPDESEPDIDGWGAWTKKMFAGAKFE
jgi:hypothetical protein